MIPLGDNFIGCPFNSIQLRKKIIKMNCFSKKNINIELTVSMWCMTMNPRRLQSKQVKRIFGIGIVIQDTPMFAGHTYYYQFTQILLRYFWKKILQLITYIDFCSKLKKLHFFWPTNNKKFTFWILSSNRILYLLPSQTYMLPVSYST